MKMKINIRSMFYIALMNSFGGWSQRLMNIDKVPSIKSQRSPEQVAVMKNLAEAKRQRKNEKRRYNNNASIMWNPCYKVLHREL